MRLGFKFALFLVLPLIGLTALFGYTYFERSQELLREELTKEGRAIALVVRTAAQDYLRDRQPADLRKLIDQISGYQRVLGLRIFGPDGRLVYQSAALEHYPFQSEAQLQRVLVTRQPIELRRSIGGEPVLGFLFPLLSERGSLLGAGQVLQLESYIRDETRTNRSFIFALSLIMATATVTIILLVTRLSVTSPVNELVKSFRIVGSGATPARVPVRSDDELGHLAREFNHMCDRLEAAKRSLESAHTQLRNAERLAGLGRLAAGLAHEIGTPLQVIRGRTDALLRHLNEDERSTRSLQAISAQIDRIVRIVRDMLDFARQKSPRREPTSISEAIRTVLDLADSQLEREHVAVRLDVPDQLPSVVGDADQLHQVFLNLTLNALDAMPSGGMLRISACEAARSNPERGGPPRRYVAVRFEDTGTGIAPEHHPHVFDPFFTTKEPGKGTGLGLSVSYGIIEEHDGWFELDSQPGHGTRITVHLPIAADGAGRNGPSEAA